MNQYTKFQLYQQIFESQIKQISVQVEWQKILIYSLKLQVYRRQMRIFIFLAVIMIAKSDCPINPYPALTSVGSLEIQINNDPRLHGYSQEYVSNLPEEMEEGAINVAIGVANLQFNPNQKVDFMIQYVPTTTVKSIKFAARLNDQLYGWRRLRFNFIASQSSLFYIGAQRVQQFSVGLTQGKYSVFIPLKTFKSTQSQTLSKIFISGIKLKAKPLDNQYSNLLSKYENFKQFSSNARLVKYFGEALQEKKSFYIKIISSKMFSKILSINLETNGEISMLCFSYIIITHSQIIEKHQFISGDFYMINDEQYKFSQLSNMKMTFFGITQLKVPRDVLYFSQLTLSVYLQQAKFIKQSNFQYFGTAYSYFSVQLKLQYVCDSCKNSPNIFQNRFCVQACPRGYSPAKRQQNTYCEICQASKLKVVDPNSMSCTCAKRHYLDTTEDVCKPCRYDCMTCDKFDKCLTCDNYLFQTKRRLSQSGKCQCSPIGYYDDKTAQNIVCQKCSSKCLTCNGPKEFDCLTCVQSKQLDFRGFCVCKNGFVQDNSNNCICVPPKILSNSVCMDYTSSCGPNQIQQYIDLTKRCICRSGYEQVLNDCIKCGQNSIFSSQQLKCKCINKTVMVNNQCIRCPFPNTQFDQSSGLCVCKSGTFKAEDGSCVYCPVKMTYRNGKCQCIYNYFEASPNICQRCIRENDGPKCRRNVA